MDLIKWLSLATGLTNSRDKKQGNHKDKDVFFTIRKDCLDLHVPLLL